MFKARLRCGIFCLAIGCSLLVKAQGVDVTELRAYGPGGPLEPITECARAFSNQEGVHVTVTGGPEEQWIAQARKDADVVFGGADYMLTELTLKYPDLINPLTRTELYTRDAVILVRKGNPKKIAEFKDLARPGVKIVDATGAGLTVPALSPFNIAVCAGSDPETFRVRLLSIAQQKHAPTIVNAPHEKPTASPGLHDSSNPPATMGIIPKRIRRSKFPRKANQASNAVSTLSRLSNREVLEAGLVAGPAISKTGATTPPDSMARGGHSRDRRPCYRVR